MPDKMPRVAAALIAMVCWFALAVQFRATFGQNGSVAETLWILLRFFTVLTNLLVAIVMTGIAFGLPRSDSPRLLGFVTLAIALVGVVYMTLLRGMLELSGGALLADTLLHKVVPILVPAYWLLWGPKGGLGRRDPVIWCVYPLGYLIYALVRGSIEGRYSYPFIDLAALGEARVALNAVLIAAAFLAAGFAFVWLDGTLARQRARG